MNQKTAKHFLPLLACGLLAVSLPTSYVSAQDDGDTQTEDQAEAAQDANDSEGENGEAERDGEESGGEDDTASSQPSTDRFIPSEEISDDLSVSFPVDI